MLYRLLLPLIVLSSTSLLSAQPQDCANAQTQGDMNACAAKAYESADKELNALYSEIVHRLEKGSDTRNMLADTQRAWITFRNKECAFQANLTEGGSSQPMVKLQCMADLTKQRVDQLKYYANCEEGDLSCPVPAR
ncbi:lysozyme inhibitor LprI family protein [Limoniibacter endophyticus]|uniref:Lysozyme inhibitor LprI-like N-terminal domain-containing protein n=2 Tax=Limoniibacter endophyticus TaxID=1565040 RepID=A0A8J3DJF7_9HYPH|nr:lysozyme inhibitor LprI family protein [Limoniibacter endophyticus]GHC73667.1 hypothetical protein GCM10010136_21960 [Limoniibacter endophyticus]